MASKPTPHYSKKIEIGLNEWEVKTLNDCLEKIIDHRGLTPFKLGGKWAKTGYRAISARNIKDGRLIAQDSIKFVDNQLYKKWMPDEIEKDDILLTSEGPLGECMIWKSDEKIVLSQRIFGLRAKKSIIFPDFLYWYIKSNIFQQELLSRQTGTTVQGIRQSELNQTRVRVPSFFEQKNIAKILTDLENKIECNIKMNKTLEAIGQALFKHWFVDFEFPDEQGRPYRSSGGKMVESELGEIPEGWEVKELPEVCDIVDCLHSKKPEYLPSSEKFLLQVCNIGDFHTLELSEKYFVSDEDYQEWTRNVEVNEGDCIITNAGLTGAIAQIPYGFFGGIGRNLTCIRPIKITPTYLLQFLVSSVGKKQILKNIDEGTIFSSLNVKGIRKIMILVPERRVMKKYEINTRALRYKIEVNVNEKAVLSNIRDLILPKLMSGKIRVPISENASGSP